MKPSRDVALGFANSIFAALVGFAVVPVYIRLLGTGSYGLIGFFATTQVVLQLFDFGLSATINREAARCVATDSLVDLGKLLHTLSVVYVATAVTVAIAATLAAPLLATEWLQSTTLGVDSIQRAVVLLAVVIACRWPLGLYQGVLLGGHKLAKVSVVAIAMTGLGSLGAIVVLSFVSTTVEAFFVWQAAVSLLHTLVLRHMAWRAVGRDGSDLRFDWSQLRQVWAFTAGVSGIAVIGTLLSQTDKIILSRILTLEAYGQYMVATVAAGSLHLIVTPAFNIIYPKLSFLYKARSESGLLAYYRRATQLLTAVLFPLATVVGVFAHDLIVVWTGNAALAQASAPILQWMLIGTTLNGVMYCPYALQLAAGRPRITLTILLILLVAMFPLTVLLSIRLGGVGGAIAWAALNVSYLFLGTWLTHRHLLTGGGRQWLTFDVIAPMAAAMAVVGGACVALRLFVPQPAAIASGLGVAAAFAWALIHVRSQRLPLAAPSLAS